MFHTILVILFIISVYAEVNIKLNTDTVIISSAFGTFNVIVGAYLFVRFIGATHEYYVALKDYLF